MRYVALLTALMACTEMEATSDLLTPVPPPAPEVSGPLPGASAPAEPFTISSEQMQENATEAKAEGVTTAAPVPAEGDALAEVEAPPEAAPETAPPGDLPAPPPATPEPASAPVLGAPPSLWPVRLVKTVPESQPPRAILGMPDGREVVVTPGALLPDQGLVVLAIGRTTVDVARVTPAGDHAAVTSLTLTSQY